jgi:ketosteroid isomerase-like protein
MTERREIDRLLRELYAARVRGDLNAVCASFAKDADFRIAGQSHATPIAITSLGVDQLRPLMALMIKTFKLSDQTILSMIVEGAKAAVHWQARVHSRVTGMTVLTELVDLVEIRDGRIASYREFFVPSQAAGTAAAQNAET